MAINQPFPTVSPIPEVAYMQEPTATLDIAYMQTGATSQEISQPMQDMTAATTTPSMLRMPPQPFTAVHQVVKRATALQDCVLKSADGVPGIRESCKNKIQRHFPPYPALAAAAQRTLPSIQVCHVAKRNRERDPLAAKADIALTEYCHKDLLCSRHDIRAKTSKQSAANHCAREIKINVAAHWEPKL